MNRITFFVLLVAIYVSAQSTYIMGEMGQNCWDACFDQGLNCNPAIQTNNNITLFEQLGITCNPDTTSWWAEDQPSYVADKTNPDYGDCVGFINVPAGVHCSGRFPATQRLCRCDAPSPNSLFFSSGCAGCAVGPEENTFFAQYITPGNVGVLTHMWTTYETSTDNGMLIKYYIDGETEASIVYTPSLGAGVGFFDPQSPWGTQWIGKGANDGAWYNNFRVPFQKSLRVTILHESNVQGFYIILRGGMNIPITVGGITLPTTAKLNQFITNDVFQPLDFVTLANVTSGAGVHWMHSIAVTSGDLNFLEGCYHAYVEDNNEFPGILLSTGTEDYFDSAWYFNGGEFHLPNAGFTHLASTSNGGVQWSAYRFHDQDPLFFTNGFQLVWRNGDMLDPSGIKCLSLEGGIIAGNPTISNVTAYAWVYTW